MGPRDGRRPSAEPRASIDYVEPAGETRAAASKTKARLEVMAWTGLPQAQLKRIRREDLDWQAKTLRIVRRRKGKGAKPRLLPLARQAIQALRRFDRLDCYGPFSNRAMWAVFQRACATLGITGLTPYVLRHSFGTLMLEATGNLPLTARLLGVTPETAQRYARKAINPLDAHGTRQFSTLATRRLRRKRAPKVVQGGKSA